MNISVFGLGYVGAVSAGCLTRLGHTVIGVDPEAHKLELMRSGKAPIVEEGVDDLTAEAIQSGRLSVTYNCAEAIAKTELSLICVGTPSAPDGSLGTIYVRRVCEEIGSAIKAKGTFHTVVIRSTVVPGTTLGLLKPILEEHSGGKAGRDFGLAMNPEFLREGTSIADFFAPPYTIIGADDDSTFDAVSQVYNGIDAPVHRCSISSAEAVKYGCNLFHAMKITFANEMGMVCKEFGIDSREVMDLLCRDTKLNISHRYLRPGFAFGGSCLPKDLRAFTALARQRSVPTPMLTGILESNRIQIERVAAKVLQSGAKKISLLGLSFKPGTDDLRESPLVTLAGILIGKGRELAIFDPNVEYAALHGANKAYIAEHLPHLKRALVSADEALNHGEFFIVGHASDAIRNIVANVAPDRFVYDLTGAFSETGSSKQQEGLYW